ncbi:ppGpp synthetase/RelA/SpoT-type nucleotidyltransferase [Flavobacterium sp. 7E]|uniref:hypothetical protein n=1 Tax=unclassified Flavobacterium TaxID=196869 RepID=UPI00156E5941|nr:MULTISPECIES: hypothetical protein [unclassified Flavobacterium]NRS88032.1 ppGpp synthetase/RelA/SpoT-type nucleotidyltransferase [Flavobacterium sp. 7E]NRT14595.1 ppGpp synthetase/RelA/SpoT-type nucleotidyltransferase [Flavobacterium sp. 28A]
MTKTQVNKVGRNIRKTIQNQGEISNEDLLILQNYRTSFQADLASVFNQISNLSKKERSDSIVSFRIKRIESILSKIKRQPTMALGNMGDVAGCRVLLYSDEALIGLVQKFNAVFNVKYFNNYLDEAKEDGYRGYHLYIESPIDSSKLIEIQLRTVTAHKWASLVEMIDILYNLKIKEGEKSYEFEEFLLLLSRKSTLTIKDKIRIIEIDKKNNIYPKLNEVFVQNHLQVRKDWVSLSNLSNNYFIIEVDFEKKTNLISFGSYKSAEERYFKMFGEKNKSNFVLTHVEKPNFRRVCIAYASYMLVNHDYLEDWNEFTKDIIMDNTIKKSQSNFDYYSEYIRRNLEDQFNLVKSEISEYNSYSEKEEKNDGLNEWLDEIKEKMKKFDMVARQHNDINKQKNKNFFRRLLG